MAEDKQKRWLTSTIAEVDWDTGRVVRVPGEFPRKEKFILYRLFMHLKRKMYRRKNSP